MLCAFVTECCQKIFVQAGDGARPQHRRPAASAALWSRGGVMDQAPSKAWLDLDGFSLGNTEHSTTTRTSSGSMIRF